MRVSYDKHRLCWNCNIYSILFPVAERKCQPQGHAHTHTEIQRERERVGEWESTADWLPRSVAYFAARWFVFCCWRRYSSIHNWCLRLSNYTQIHTATAQTHTHTHMLLYSLYSLCWLALTAATTSAATSFARVEWLVSPAPTNHAPFPHILPAEWWRC